VLRDGVSVGRSGSREPRSAAGLASDGRELYLLVADGRRRDSAGLTNYETGLWLAWLGCEIGMTFDGGGSTDMAVRGRDGRPRSVNVPIEGGMPGRERAVGSCLGFRVGAAR
jgi:exopolysaccharide biosynthesis protein